MRAAALFVLLPFALTGCDILESALDVDIPSSVPAEQLVEDPANAGLLTLGAVGDFECAFNAYVVLAGMTADELTDATQTANRWVYDRREVEPDDSRYATFGCTALGTYTPLSTARWAADNAHDLIRDWPAEEVENRETLMATAAAFAGYSRVLLGEGFCSVAIDQSAALSSQEVFAQAEDWFGRAITAAQAAGDDELLNLALVGRARARLNMGLYEQAAADAELVTEGFEYVATASGNSFRRQNRVFQQNIQSEAVSIGPAFRDLEWQGQPDPRVDLIDTGDFATDGTPMFLQTKYESIGTPLPIATWDEAQLIIAEAAARANDLGTAVGIINMFHDRAGLDPFASSNQQEVLDHVIQERARELFLESHRFYDVRRLGLPLVPPPGTPFDNGGFYGDDRCWPLPDVERRNNPNI